MRSACRFPDHYSLLQISLEFGRSSASLIFTPFPVFFICFGRNCVYGTLLRQGHLMQRDQRSALTLWAANVISLRQPKAPQLIMTCNLSGQCFSLSSKCDVSLHVQPSMFSLRSNPSWRLTSDGQRATKFGKHPSRLHNRGLYDWRRRRTCLRVHFSCASLTTVTSFIVLHPCE